MRTSYNNPLKSNGIKRIILILLVTVLIAAYVPVVNSSYAYADSYDYDNAYYMLSLVNQQRAAYGLSAVEMDSGMLDAAMTRAYECTYYFSHYRPDGGDASTLDSTTNSSVYRTVNQRALMNSTLPPKISLKFRRPIKTGSFAIPFHSVRE